MAKYIDADLLRKEIEKRLKNIRDYMSGTGMRYKGPKYFNAQGKESAYDALLSIIDSLQQEQPEVDLEEEIERYTRETTNLPITHKRTPMDIMESDWVRCARHFYELGKNSK